MMMFARKTSADAAFPGSDLDLIVSFKRFRLEREMVRIGDSLERSRGIGDRSKDVEVGDPVPFVWVEDALCCR